MAYWLNEAREEANKKSNPSDDPVGSEANRAPKTPVEAFLDEAEKLYARLEGRIEPDNWRILFATEVCQHIDTASEVRSAFLTFLTTKSQFPQSVWRVFDEVFGLSDRRDELVETGGEGFADTVINAIKHPHTTVYEELLVLGDRAQSFLDKLAEAEGAILWGYYYRVDVLIREMEDILVGQTNVMVLKARLHAIMGRVGEALEIFDKEIARGKRNLDLSFFRGETLQRLGRMTEAAQDFLQALEIKPASLGSIYHLAKCQLATGFYVEAAASCKKLLNHYPFNGEMRSLLMSAQHYRIEELRRLSHWHEDPAVVGELADLLYHTGQKDDCRDVIFDAEQRGITDPWIEYVHSVLVAEQGDRAAARDILARVLQRCPDNSRFWMQMAEYCSDSKDYEAAFPAYERALLHLAPEEDPSIYNNYAYALIQAGRYEQALEQCARGLREHVNFPHLYKIRALAEKHLERYSDVVASAEKALAQQPGFEEVYDLYFHALQEQSRYQDIHGLYKRAMDNGVNKPEYAIYKANAYRSQLLIIAVHILLYYVRYEVSQGQGLSPQHDLAPAQNILTSACLLNCNIKPHGNSPSPRYLPRSLASRKCTLLRSSLRS